LIIQEASIKLMKASCIRQNRNRGYYCLMIFCTTFSSPYKRKKYTPRDKAFSIEYDFFAKQTSTLSFDAFPCEGYFIDIGIPEDYARAQEELKVI